MTTEFNTAAVGPLRVLVSVLAAAVSADRARVAQKAQALTHLYTPPHAFTHTSTHLNLPEPSTSFQKLVERTLF